MVLIKNIINNILFIMIEVIFVARMKVGLNVKFIYCVCYRGNFSVA